MTKLLKGRVTRRDERKGTHALVEDWGGVYSAVAYGDENVLREMQSRLDYKTTLYPICRRCGKVRVIDCECKR